MLIVHPSTALAGRLVAFHEHSHVHTKTTIKQQVDHTDLVNRVMAQISTLNLPLAASALLVQALQAKIGSPNFGRGGGVAAAVAAAGPELLGGNGNPAQGEWGARGGALSLEERQLQLEERLQASREAEAAQALAERRLKLMEVNDTFCCCSVLDVLAALCRSRPLVLCPLASWKHTAGVVCDSLAQST